MRDPSYTYCRVIVVEHICDRNQHNFAVVASRARDAPRSTGYEHVAVNVVLDCQRLQRDAWALSGGLGLCLEVVEQPLERLLEERLAIEQRA